VRDHYRLRDAAEERERLRSDERASADERRARQRRDAALAREHDRQMERVALREERIERQSERARQRRVAYFQALDASARSRRLVACRQRAADCMPLTSELMEAAASDVERRALAQLNESPEVPDARERPAAVTQTPAREEPAPQSPAPQVSAPTTVEAPEGGGALPGAPSS
jgi:hypothetical protein